MIKIACDLVLKFAKNYDAIICSGGASRGEKRFHAPKKSLSLGYSEIFGSLNIKPGGPF